MHPPHLESLVDPDYFPLINLQKQIDEVQALVDKCMYDKVGNSVILLGKRTQGSAAVVKHVLKDAICKVVTLNGYLLHDSYSILKHLSWYFSEETNGSIFTVYEQFGEYLEANSEKPIIFVLEEMEQFTMVPGQNLLYTLFEAPSNLRLPILVIGLTEKYDVVSMLEKRVKSRFSQHIIAISDGRSTTFDGYLENIKAALCHENNSKAFNDKLAALIYTPSVKEALFRCFMHSPTLHYALSKIVSLIPETPNGRHKIDPKVFSDTLAAGCASTLHDILTNATEPMMIIMIALFRLEAKNHGQCRPSFESVLSEVDEMRRMSDHNKVSHAFTVSPETLKLAWCSLEDHGIFSRPHSSWIAQTSDAYRVHEPLTNLYDNLPETCPDHLRSMAQLD